MVIKTVQPDASYEREVFQEAVQSYFGLEGLIKEAEKNARNPQILSLGGKLLRDDEQFYLGFSNGNGDVALVSDLNIAGPIYENALVTYTRDNFNGIVSDTSGEQLRGIAIRLPYTSIDNKELDKIGDVINEFNLLNEVLKKGDERAMDNYLMGRLQDLESSRDPHDRFILVAYLNGKGIPGYITQSIKSYAKQNQIEFRQVLTDSTDNQFQSLINQSFEKSPDNLKQAYVGTVLGSFAPQQNSN